MKSNVTSIFALLSAVALASCSVEPLNEGLEPSGDFDNVIIRAHNFVWSENPSTKTSLTVSETDGAVFSWKAGDIVGIYPDVGTQVRFPIVEGLGEDTQVAKFTGGGWAVKGAHKYMAYYPFIPDMDLDKTAVPVDYTGQIQDGNGSTAHLSPFDYMAAAGSAPSDGEISFDFKHLGALLMLNLTVPKVGEYTSLTLTCQGTQFATKGTIDITADDPAITPTDWSNEFVIHLNNLTTTQANENVVVYALIPPVDMSEQTITVNLRGDHADCETSFTRGKNKPFLAGRSYRPNMGVMVGGDVIKLESGHQFNEDIKSLVNGEHFIYDKTDYRIKSISFEVGDDEVPSEYDRVDVSAPDSPSPIYAFWKPGTGELVVRTPSNRVFANEDASGLFHGLSGLNTIDFGGFDLSYSESIADMFAGCSSIESLDLSEWNTAGITSFSGLFRDCKSLTTLDISSFNVEQARWLGSMFSGCKSLESLDLNHFKTSSDLESVAEMFSGCEQLNSLTFGDHFNTTSVSDFYYMFSGCKKIEQLDLSMFDTSNALEIRGMFSGCNALRQIIGDISITNKVTDLGFMFAYCTSLESLDVSEWDVSEVTSMRDTFNACFSLTSLDVSDWHVSNVVSFETTFYNCKNLETLDVSRWNTSSVETFGGTFALCSSLQALDVSNFVTNNVRYFGSMFTCCTNITSLNLGSFNTSNAESFAGMFSGCDSLTELDLSGFDTSAANDLGGMFRDCSGLSSIDISSFDFSHVISMGGFFENCTSLKNVNFGSFDTHYCENFDRMFAGSGFEVLDLTFMNTSSATSMSGMFDGCEDLTKLDISSFDTSHVTENYGGFFNKCYLLSEVRMNNSFRMIGPWYFACNMARDVESCTIYCSQDFKDAWLSTEGVYGPDESKLFWVNCDTGEPLE